MGWGWVGDGPRKSLKFKGEGIRFSASVGNGDEDGDKLGTQGWGQRWSTPPHFHPYIKVAYLKNI